jgi:hypothetical protein
MSRADERALAQGWFVASESYGDVIERDDDQDVFPDDVAAVRFVLQQAYRGDALARAALERVLLGDDTAWDSLR